MSTPLSHYLKDRRNNNFNLVRFIAATLVLYTHAFAVVYGSGDAEPLRAWLGMTWGSIAVDVFFVSSGFLIAGSLFQRNNLLAFAWARILRIYPALIAAVLFAVFVVGPAFTSLSATEYLGHRDTWSHLVRNILLFAGLSWNLPGVFEDLPYARAVNGSLWTLPYELKMYFYLAVVGTALVWLQKTLGRDTWVRRGLLAVAVIAVLGNVANHFHAFSTSHLLPLFSMFFVGAACYSYREKLVISSPAAAVAAVLLTASLLHRDVFFVTYCVAMPYLLFYLVYVPKGWIRKFNTFGDYSYGIYIYAFPVQQSVMALMPQATVTTNCIISFSITLVLAYASWHLIEKRALKMKNGYQIVERGIQRLWPSRPVASPAESQKPHAPATPPPGETADPKNAT